MKGFMQCVSSAILYFCLTSETQAYNKHKTNLKWDIKQRQFGSSVFLVFDFFGIFSSWETWEQGLGYLFFPEKKKAKSLP